MATNWISGFFVPLLKALVLISFFGGLFLFLAYHIRKYYKLRAKWFIKYYIFGKDYDKDVMIYCSECIDNEEDYYKVKMRLLVQGMPQDEINDIMYVFKKVSKSLKGGVDYGRSIKRYNFKNKEGKRN